MSTYFPVPVLTPTLGEFADFSAYIQKVRPAFEEAGLVKIIPPKGWAKNLPTEKDINNMFVKPIQQVVNGQKGVFEVLNIEKKPMLASAFEKAAGTHEKQESCKAGMANFTDLERRFWKNITRFPPLYGADNLGSLFEKAKCSWNLRKIASLLDLLEVSLPGINEPYLYFGMWKAMFAWHTEDMELYSVNYLHFGAPKHWYVVRPCDKERFDRVAEGYFADQRRQCSEFLRHKTSLISPSVLQYEGLQLGQVTQEAGNFIVTYPNAYHMGFNQGFNCAESMNFALENWLPYGRKARSCVCQPDTVRFVMEAFEQTIEAKKKKKMDPATSESPAPATPDGKAPVEPTLSMQIVPTMIPAVPPSESNAQHESWQLNCVCGIRVDSADPLAARVGNLLTFECSKCKNWAHVNCFPKYTQLEQLPEEMFCHNCQPLQPRKRIRIKKDD